MWWRFSDTINQTVNLTQAKEYLDYCAIIEYFSAPILVRAVIDSSEYLCTSIPTVRHYYLNSYEEIATCKSCGYGDPKYPHS